MSRIRAENNKWFVVLMCLTVFGFVFFTIGGEFLHNHLHHHAPQTSRDQCPFYQLQTQLFVAVSYIITALFLKTLSRLFFTYQTVLLPFCRKLPDSQAPPAFLS